jgi:hypothetical protein
MDWRVAWKLEEGLTEYALSPHDTGVPDRVREFSDSTGGLVQFPLLHPHRIPAKTAFRVGRLSRPSAHLVGRIFSVVYLKTPSSRNSWTPKPVQPAAVNVTPLAWTPLHERSTLQYKDKDPPNSSPYWLQFLVLNGG